MLTVRTCPFCAEQVRDEAIKCKHCGSELPVYAPPAALKPSSKVSPKTIIFATLFAAVVLGADLVIQYFSNH